MTANDPPLSETPSEPERMHCMEVWGGNRAVQRYFLMAGLEMWVYSQPHARASGGGDVYYVSSCASGRITRTLLADVSGHGSGVALLATGLRDLMRRNVNFIQQDRLVAAMNRQFGELAAEGGFATALVATFFAPNRLLSVSNAGHPQPFLLRADAEHWTYVEPRAPHADRIENTPLGVVEEAVYPSARARLEVGDLVLCYSDALSEARDSQGRHLGVEGLRKLLDTLLQVPPSGLINALLAALRQMRPDNLAEDDATILLFRATGSQPGWKDNLLAPFRLLAPPRDATQLRVEGTGPAGGTGLAGDQGR